MSRWESIIPQTVSGTALWLSHRFRIRVSVGGFSAARRPRKSVRRRKSRRSVRRRRRNVHRQKNRRDVRRPQRSAHRQKNRRGGNPPTACRRRRNRPGADRWGDRPQKSRRDGDPQRSRPDGDRAWVSGRGRSSCRDQTICRDQSRNHAGADGAVWAAGVGR